MRSLLLSPHNDDDALFASGLILRHRPHVVVVLRSQVQEDRGYGITAALREAETDEAMRVLGVTWEQWQFSDAAPDWDAIRLDLQALSRRYDHCFAPAPEPGGHEQHNRIGRLADDVFGHARCTFYLTYTRSGGKSTGGTPVLFEPGWAATKTAALRCYRTQREHPSTAPHFERDLTEYAR